MLTGVLFGKPQGVKVTVSDGMVTLSGTLPRADLIPIAERLASEVDGVVTVTCKLTGPVTHARNLSAAVDVVVAGSQDHDLPGLTLAPCLVRDALLAQGQARTSRLNGKLRARPWRAGCRRGCQYGTPIRRHLRPPVPGSAGGTARRRR